MNIQQALQYAMLRLASESARLDAEVLLGHVLKQGRTFLYTWPEAALNELQQSQFEQLVYARAKGQPVAYLTGSREFWSLPLQVNTHTLIPRPETELLVELALQHLGDAARVLDLGTGSGAIALALASERRQCEIWATDASVEALQVAKANAQRLQLPVRFEHSNWFEYLDPLEQFDLILSNPPYISSSDRHLQEGDVRFEPKTALVSGCDGLQDIRQIVASAPDYLYPGAWLMLEHGHEQGEDVRQILVARGFVDVETAQDYGGRDRVTLGCWEGDDCNGVH